MLRKFLGKFFVLDKSKERLRSNIPRFPFAPFLPTNINPTLNDSSWNVLNDSSRHFAVLIYDYDLMLITCFSVANFLLS